MENKLTQKVSDVVRKKNKENLIFALWLGIIGLASLFEFHVYGNLPNRGVTNPDGSITIERNNHETYVLTQERLKSPKVFRESGINDRDFNGDGINDLYIPRETTLFGQYDHEGRLFYSKEKLKR